MSACLRITVLSLLSIAVAVPPAGAQERLSIDRLYSLPRIIGTAPTGRAWSPDGERLAFLWNDGGMNFRDVWVVDVGDGEPTRVTAFPRPETVGAGNDVEALRRNQRAEQADGVDAVTWYPDGRHLLVSLDGDLYRAAPGREPELLGEGGERASFSPDGRFLAFLEDRDLWVSPVADDRIGLARRVTEVAGDGVGISEYLWSPDSRRVAVIERDRSGVPERLIPDYLGEEVGVDRVRRAFPGEEPGRSRLGIFELDGGGGRWLLADEDDRDLIFSVDWSPEGDRLLVDRSDLYVKDRRLLSVDVGTGAATLLYRELEPQNVMAFWSAAWGPEGEWAYFVSDRDDFYHLYRVREPGTEPQPVTSGDWAVADFHVAADALFVVANREHPAERHLYRVPLEGGEPERLSRRPGTHEPVYSPDGRRAAVLFSSDEVPPDLFLNRLDSPGEARVTSSPLPGFEEHEWVTPEYVTFPSHVDGATIHGRLMRPPGFDPSRKYPAIIGSIYSNTLRNQWGGRNAHPTWGLDQYLLQQGYVLLNVNIRGSWGLGREFRRRMQHDYGGIDVEDVYSGVLYLESLGSVDMDRVGIWGSSYGGLLTAMSLFEHPEAFAAGVAGAPATNVWHATTGEMRVMGPPDEYPDAYANASAFTRAAGLEDPLMIIHGMRDRIVLFKDSLVLLERLMLLGKGHLVEFVPVPNARHGWDAGALYQTRYAFEKLTGFFERHLR